jgi:hypothetical protein
MNTAQKLLHSFFSPFRRTPSARAKTFLKPYNPRVNRHTGKPHEHKREISRRQRQAAGR